VCVGINVSSYLPATSGHMVPFSQSLFSQSLFSQSLFSQSLLDQGVRERQSCSKRSQGGLQMEQDDLDDLED
jgi:hypothetical protein